MSFWFGSVRRPRLGSPMFHLGMLGVIGGHALGLLVPASVTEAVGISEHAYHLVAVSAGTVAGTLLLVGLALLIARRIVNRRVRRATTTMDKVLYVALAAMVGLGMFATVATNVIGDGYDYRSTIAVWFRGIFWLHPQSELMTDVPLAYQLHALGGFVLLALWPFTRLVHVWSAPLAYLLRPYVVYRSRRGPAPAAAPTPAAVRDAEVRDAERRPVSSGR